MGSARGELEKSGSQVQASIVHCRGKHVGTRTTWDRIGSFAEFKMSERPLKWNCASQGGILANFVIHYQQMRGPPIVMPTPSS
jgi:hypothetical protein